MTAASTYDNYYAGFLYSLKVWNKNTDLSNSADPDGTSTCTGSCTYCPLTGVCLSTCDINSYE